MIKVSPNSMAQAERYADAVHNLAFAVQHMNGHKLPTLFNDIDLFKECREIEDAVRDIRHNFEQIDCSNVKVGHYYKRFYDSGRSAWNHYEVYLYKVTDVNEDNWEMSTESIKIHQYGVLTNDDLIGQNDFKNLRYFAGLLNKGEITEITEEEWNEAIRVNELFHKVFKDFGGIKYEQLEDID